MPDDQLVAGPAPRGGSGDTVGNTAYGPNFVQSAGATFRLVVDVGDWDASLAMNASGQCRNCSHPARSTRPPKPVTSKHSSPPSTPTATR
ncbi:penicillin acylase family protein [Amycolatopsis sp. A1MSW2902]|uniref:penicillin acylase family protein n=1 Tax=Amycolatopsis sp. A1MSW2902 TaxID=687413 RepID=UPI00307D9DE3